MQIAVQTKRVGHAMQVTLLVLVASTGSSCAGDTQIPSSTELPPTAIASPDSDGTTSSVERTSPERAAADQKYAKARAHMVATQLAKRDIVDERVLDTMKKVPRHEFVPEAIRRRAYQDSPLPIGHRQTISQPYIVALMTQLVDPQAQKKALDIGTGSGYQAAVLAKLVKSVYSIEIVEPLAIEARERLKTLGYNNVTVRHGDGYAGWPSEAPFDIIIVAAAPDHVPQPLVDQLAPGGKMVIPVGEYFQRLLLIEKHEDGSTHRKSVAPVTFVPMTGAAQQKKNRAN